MHHATTTMTGARGDSPMPPQGERAWYLYGITRRPLATTLPGVGAESLPGRGDSAPLLALEFGELAAIVRPVPAAEYSAEALEARLGDLALLEATVRVHNAVIDAIHRQQAILPAKFGSVYARTEDVTGALRQGHDRLRDQLCHIEGGDEWAVHVYADRAVIARRAAEEHSRASQLRREAAARPGRAYLLQRRLAGELAAATDRLLDELAQAAFEQFAPLAIDVHVSPPGAAASGNTGEIELLRAAFLVPREGADTFLAGVRSFADRHEAVRCDYSGPWPPYSFAALPQEEPR